MNPEESKARILRVVGSLRDSGSWAGQTHVQKTVYILQETVEISFGFDFIMYIYGPFSFALKDTVGELLADALLAVEPQPAPYRPKLKLTERGATFVETHQLPAEFSNGHLRDQIAHLAPMGVVELERLSTAIYVLKNRNGDGENPTQELMRIKPHIVETEAQAAITEAKKMLNGRSLE